MEKKPILFQSACIFSIAGSSIGFISMMFATLFFDFVASKIELVTNVTATDELSRFYFASLMAAFALSLAGAIQLYKLRRIGLYFYLSAQIIILFLPVIWMGSNAFSVTNAVFTIIFSGVYIYYFKIYSNDKSAIVSR
jgi:hypothetical protein